MQPSSSTPIPARRGCLAVHPWAEVAVAATEREPQARLWALGACLGLLGTAVQASTPPERAEVQFKALDYRERQPGANRVDVQAATMSLYTPVGERAALLVSQTVDAISGASPLYHTQRLTPLKDFRRAWSAAGTGYFNNGSLTATASTSDENDYHSKAGGLTGTWNSTDRNTSLTGGVGVSSDVIRPVYGGFEDRKIVRDALVGMTRVLTPRDIVQATLSHTWGSGYFTDPYKLLDERPRTRHISRGLLRWNHHIGGTDQTLRMSYRYSTDSWALKSHTATIEWVSPMGRGWTVTPSMRAYSQTAARFYLPVDPKVAPAPPFPRSDALYYSADQRLSAFGAYTLGIRVDKAFNRDWSADVKFEHYQQRGAWAWAGGGDRGLAPFTALWLQLGLVKRF
ncbi:MAG: DUF3570 domain-containing protein [Betaproteobacteria bacterium]|nr:DUF3570 domain-containing protein [Betaproteobacteria bacterium]